MTFYTKLLIYLDLVPLGTIFYNVIIPVSVFLTFWIQDSIFFFLNGSYNLLTLLLYFLECKIYTSINYSYFYTNFNSIYCRYFTLYLTTDNSDNRHYIVIVLDYILNLWNKGKYFINYITYIYILYTFSLLYYTIINILITNAYYGYLLVEKELHTKAYLHFYLSRIIVVKFIVAKIVKDNYGYFRIIKL